MVQFAWNTGNAELKEYWEYALKALNILQHDGMSDEEDVEEDITVDGVATKRLVRIVKILGYRHESFRGLFKIIDATRGLEDLIFNQSGRSRIPRKRVNIVDLREPPKDLPKSVFRQEYLNQLSEFDIEELRISEQDFEIRE
ncbi:hypothetical protein GGU10DRAFT_279977 [Lentinula aff. detonsa]|uniref:Uncharacterized protein n=1 Tax=Lentinula aff. detonsa TaxID=2804958 RepID=A0AA38KT31_9AGAR|nr:hypothetical protein GGU10DRAFT_279977 [Lentinula aff. detonsa]